MYQEVRTKTIAALERLNTQERTKKHYTEFIQELKTCSEDDFMRYMLACAKSEDYLRSRGLTLIANIQQATGIIFRTVILPYYERHLNKSLVAQSEAAPKSEIEAKKQFIRDFFTEYNIDPELLDAHLVIHHGVVYRVVGDELNRTDFGAFMFKMYLKYKELSNA